MPSGSTAFCMYRLYVILLLPLLIAAGGAPSRERQQQLLYLLRQDCGSCHGLTLKGGIGPSLLPDALADRDVDSLAGIILEGVPGTPMPPWKSEISPTEARWLAGRLREGIR